MYWVGRSGWSGIEFGLNMDLDYAPNTKNCISNKSDQTQRTKRETPNDDDKQFIKVVGVLYAIVRMRIKTHTYYTDSHTLKMAQNGNNSVIKLLPVSKWKPQTLIFMVHIAKMASNSMESLPQLMSFESELLTNCVFVFFSCCWWKTNTLAFIIIFI